MQAQNIWTLNLLHISSQIRCQKYREILEGKVNVVLCTDIASRGLDTTQVSWWYVNNVVIESAKRVIDSVRVRVSLCATLLHNIDVSLAGEIPELTDMFQFELWQWSCRFCQLFAKECWSHQNICQIFFGLLRKFLIIS